MGDKFWWINSKLYLVGRKYGQSIVNLKQEIFENVIFSTTLLVLFPNVLLINGQSVPFHICMKPKKLDKGKINGFSPTNQNYLYYLHWFCSDIEIISLYRRPAICTLIGFGAKVLKLALACLVSMVWNNPFSHKLNLANSFQLVVIN